MAHQHTHHWHDRMADDGRRGDHSRMADDGRRGDHSRMAGGDQDGRRFGPPDGEGRRRGGPRDRGPARRHPRFDDRASGSDPGLRVGLAGLIGAIRQVGIVGDEGQQTSTLALLDETTRSVYRILAAGPRPTVAESGAPSAPDGVTATSPATLGEADVADAGAAS